MDMPVEVVARFGETMLAAVVVARDFRIGTGPDVDLALPGFRSFPLVDAAGLVRIPTGITAVRAGAPISAGTAMAGTESIELVFGAVRVTITAGAALPSLPAPPRIDRRLAPYALGALVAHLSLWVAATVLADPPPPHAPRSLPALLLRHAAIPKTPLPPPPAPHPKKKIASAIAAAPAGPEAPPATPAAARASGARRAQDLVGHADLGAAVAAIMGTVDIGAAVAGAGPLYREDEAHNDDFSGRNRKFDPTGRAGWGTIASGRYATVSSGTAVGDGYELRGPRPAAGGEVEMCEGERCAASGALDSHAVTSWIEPHTAELAACFERSDAASDASVLLAFTISGDGTVHALHGGGGPVLRGCLATVVGAVGFPRTGHITEVRYPIRFRHASAG